MFRSSLEVSSDLPIPAGLALVNVCPGTAAIVSKTHVITIKILFIWSSRLAVDAPRYGQLRGRLRRTFESTIVWSVRVDIRRCVNALLLCALERDDPRVSNCHNRVESPPLRDARE